MLVAEIPNQVKGVTRLSQHELTMLDYVKQIGSISLEEALDILAILRGMAQRLLKELVDKELLKSQGSGKNTAYVLPKKQ